MKQLILGSQSPRRREIMSYFSLPFDQATSFFDEESVLFHGNPAAYASEISQGKSQSLHAMYPNAIILTADTVVYKDGKIYGKPKDEQEAFQYLSELVDQWHSVITAVTVRCGEQTFSATDETRVLFNPLTPEQIAHYHRKIHWADKAGGYDIRMAGGLLIRKIEGCYYNVTGLPINTVRELLLKVDIELWDYLKNGTI